MGIKAMIAPSVLAVLALFSMAATGQSRDLSTYQDAVAHLARSTRNDRYTFLAGLGQFYCIIKAGVGEPYRPERFLAAMYRKRPETQPASVKSADIQLRAVMLADTLVCPD